MEIKEWMPAITDTIKNCLLNFEIEWHLNKLPRQKSSQLVWLFATTVPEVANTSPQVCMHFQCKSGENISKATTAFKFRKSLCTPVLCRPTFTLQNIFPISHRRLIFLVRTLKNYSDSRSGVFHNSYLKLKLAFTPNVLHPSNWYLEDQCYRRDLWLKVFAKLSPAWAFSPWRGSRIPDK